MGLEGSSRRRLLSKPIATADIGGAESPTSPSWEYDSRNSLGIEPPPRSRRRVLSTDDNRIDICVLGYGSYYRYGPTPSPTISAAPTAVPIPAPTRYRPTPSPTISAAPTAVPTPAPTPLPTPGPTTTSSSPADVHSGDKTLHILDDNGGVWYAGYEYGGRLGSSTSSSSGIYTLTRITNLNNVQKLDQQGMAGIALTGAGEVW